jgi:DNA polymerase III subunit delta
MIVVLTGANTFLLNRSLGEIVSNFTENSGDSIERFDAQELSSADVVLDAVRSISFLEPKKLVIVRDFAQNKDVVLKIEELIKNTADSTDLVLVDQKLDKRTSMYKFLKKECDVRSFDALQPHELEKWFASQASELGADISTQNIRFIIDRTGPNQQLLYSELEKLTLHTSSITKEVIEMLLEPTPQSVVFEMLEALFSGDARKAHELYIDQRAQGEEPQKLLAMITWQLQQLTLAVFSPNKTIASLTALGMSPYSAQKTLKLATNISKSDLKFFITELADIDMQSKTSADVESALAVYFAEVTERLKS